MKLATERFTLETLTEVYATERYLGWLRDPDVIVNLMSQRSVQTLDTIRAYIRSHDNRTKFLFGIFTEDASHIGNLSVRHYPDDERASIGVMIGERAYWGAGVVLETRGRLLDFIFNDLNCQKAHAGCFGHNSAALFNFKKQRWKHEGTRYRQYKYGERFYDEVFFAMFAEDWTKS